MPDVRIRERTDADLTALVETLAAQQPISHYPLTWPLPFPAEQLLRSEDDLAAWTAELEGRPAGQVCLRRVEPSRGDQVRAWMSSHGRPADELAELAALFVGDEIRGAGVGGRLIDTAVGWMRRHDLAPCLTVVSDPRNSAADMYQRKGWLVVHRSRPRWLAPPARELLAMVLPR